MGRINFEQTRDAIRFTTRRAEFAYEIRFTRSCRMGLAALPCSRYG